MRGMSKTYALAHAIRYLTDAAEGIACLVDSQTGALVRCEFCEGTEGHHEACPLVVIERACLDWWEGRCQVKGGRIWLGGGV